MWVYLSSIQHKNLRPYKLYGEFNPTNTNYTNLKVFKVAMVIPISVCGTNSWRMHYFANLKTSEG